MRRAIPIFASCALLFAAGASQATPTGVSGADEPQNTQVVIWDGTGDPSGIVDMNWLNNEDWVGFARTWTNTRWLPSNMALPANQPLNRMRTATFGGAAPSAPEPTAALLYGAGLVVFAAVGKRRRDR